MATATRGLTKTENKANFYVKVIYHLSGDFVILLYDGVWFVHTPQSPFASG